MQGIQDETRFPIMDANSSDTIGMKTRDQIVPGDYLMTPDGTPDMVSSTREVGPDLYLVDVSSGPFQDSFLAGIRQRLYLSPRSWPVRHFDERMDSFNISWVRGNLMRRVSIPLNRVCNANLVWRTVTRSSPEKLCLPLEVYDILSPDKKKDLCLVRKTEQGLIDVPFKIAFLGHGFHKGIRMAGDGLFVSDTGFIYNE